MIKLQGKSYIMTKDEVLCVERKFAVQEIDGKPVQRDSLCFEIVCNVQPLAGLELLMVPEGDRFREQFWVFQDNSESEKVLFLNDLVTRQGFKYQVQQAENWRSYTRSRMVRLDVGPQAVNTPV